jgi:TolA-binding protein
MHSVKTLFAALIAVSLFGGQPAVAADTTRGGLTGLFGELWAKLRAATPRGSAGQATAGVTLTAGIRGEEATESELKPYWKGDLEQDPGYRAERQAMQAAQDMADAGKYAEAGRAFDAFVLNYPKSTLAPNALFAGALMHAAEGDKARATVELETFLKQNAQHALAQDAERALAALR